MSNAITVLGEEHLTVKEADRVLERINRKVGDPGRRGGAIIVFVEIANDAETRKAAATLDSESIGLLVKRRWHGQKLHLTAELQGLRAIKDSINLFPMDISKEHKRLYQKANREFELRDLYHKNLRENTFDTKEEADNSYKTLGPRIFDKDKVEKNLELFANYFFHSHTGHLIRQDIMVSTINEHLSAAEHKPYHTFVVTGAYHSENIKRKLNSLGYSATLDELDGAWKQSSRQFDDDLYAASKKYLDNDRSDNTILTLSRGFLDEVRSPNKIPDLKAYMNWYETESRIEFKKVLNADMSNLKTVYEQLDSSLERFWRSKQKSVNKA